MGKILKYQPKNRACTEDNFETSPAKISSCRLYVMSTSQQQYQIINNDVIEEKVKKNFNNWA